MTSLELLQLIGVALAGGALTKISGPLVSILTARQQGRKVEAEATKLEVEAGETPFRQATWLITNLRERVIILESNMDEDRKDREKLLTDLGECHRMRDVLSSKVDRLEEVVKAMGKQTTTSKT